MSDCCIELIVSEETPVELQVCEQDQIGLEIKEQIVYGGGGIIPVGTKTIEVTENGTVTDDVTYYAAVEIDVDVPNTYEAGDEGKVVDDGALVSQSSTNITTNGTYDTTLNNEAIVAVPASAVDTGTKDITHNGNGQDVVGYAAVNVAVPNSYAAEDEGKVVSSGALVSQGSAEYTENGTYDTTLVSSVEVAVPGDAPSGTKQIEITENGTNTENVAGYAYAEIEVAVPNTYAAGDEGKVVDDGELVAQTSLGVNENGTYDTTLNNQVVVSVPNTYTAGDEGKVVSNGELVSQGSATYTSNNTYDTTLIDEVTVNVSGGGSPNLQTVSKTYTPTESQQTEQITPGTGYDGLAEVDVTVNAVSSSYVGSGVTRRSSTDLSASGDTVSVPAGYYENSASKAVAAGTAGTPVATKGAVSNHSIDVTPSVINSAGYIASETKTGTAVTVTAAELVSGSETKTANGTYDVTNLASLVVNVSGGGGGGLTTIASGTFTGNNNGDNTAGAGRQLINIGKKMAQTDFWIFVYVANGEEFEYSSSRQFVWLSAMARHELGGFDLSTTGHKSFVSSYSVDSNNGGTITTRAAGDMIRNGKQIYNGSIDNINTFNQFAIWRESDHFEVLMGFSNTAYKFPAKTYNYEVVYFGSNAATDIIEIT